MFIRYLVEDKAKVDRAALGKVDTVIIYKEY